MLPEQFRVTNGAFKLNYKQACLLKYLREVDDEEFAEQVCEGTTLNNVVSLYTYNEISPSECAAITFVSKHMKNLSDLVLFNQTGNALREILELLRKRCLKRLEVDMQSGFTELDLVFGALLELNCTLNHTHTRLTHLVINGFGTVDVDLSRMCEFFKNGHANQLKKLKLWNDNFGLSGISQLCEALNNENCMELTELQLKRTSLCNEGANVIMETLLKGLRNLTTLKLIHCSLTDHCTSRLVKALQDENSKLTELSLLGNAIGDGGALMLFRDCLTKEHCKVTKLCLNECSLTDQCIVSLCKALEDERCQLTVLSLGGNTLIGDKGADMLFCEGLAREHCKLTEMRLNNCSLTSKCIPSLCKALQDERCQLNVLSLHKNAICDEGASMLMEEALGKEHCKLNQLDLDYCALTDQCIPSFCKALQSKYCVLTKLILLGNDITESGERRLLDVINNARCEVL